MTRTYVVGDVSDELREYHRLCKEALDRVVAAVKPGVNGRALFEIPCDLFAEHGYPTQLTKSRARCSRTASSTASATASGSRCTSGRGSARVGDDLVAGDVIALEPGLYRQGSAASGSRTSRSSRTTASRS